MFSFFIKFSDWTQNNVNVTHQDLILVEAKYNFQKPISRPSSSFWSKSQVRNFVFSSRSLKTREKYISFAQLVLLSLYFFEGSVFTFQFWNDKIHNYVKKNIIYHSKIEK